MMDDHVPHVIAIEEEDDMQEGHLVGHSGEGMSHGPKVVPKGRIECCLRLFRSLMVFMCLHNIYNDHIGFCAMGLNLMF